MAALTRPSDVVIRAAVPGEGRMIASLWRELWDAHEAWGGYPGSRDPRVYAQLANRLDDDARVRAGHPILGRHVHLVADVGGVACGQVEGWFERNGVDTSTPFTCEVRSLVVTARTRRHGAGRALLASLAEAANSLVRASVGGRWSDSPGRNPGVVLAAEVLEPNPAHSFYERVGYAPVSWNARIEAMSDASSLPASYSPSSSWPCSARLGAPQDALSIARLESTLALRRRAVGDIRFDRPRAIDATLLGAIAAHLASGSDGSMREPLSLVLVDASGVVRGAASFSVHTLEPPFVPMRRALLGRFALDPALAATPLFAPLVALARRLALARGAAHVELTDLSAPGTELHDAALAAGARPWSRVVTRMGSAG
jgi:GNAT superfamily N-acetyltransferase